MAEIRRYISEDLKSTHRHTDLPKNDTHTRIMHERNTHDRALRIYASCMCGEQTYPYIIYILYFKVVVVKGVFCAYSPPHRPPHGPWFGVPNRKACGADERPENRRKSRLKTLDFVNVKHHYSISNILRLVVKIEKDIPHPENAENRHSRNEKSVFHEVQIGDSFLADENLYRAARMFSSRNPEFKFCAKKQPCGEFRIWRIQSDKPKKECRPLKMGRPTEYPIENLKVGDSLSFPEENRAKSSCAFNNYRRKHPDFKYTSRKQPDGTVRFWRIA